MKKSQIGTEQRREILKRAVNKYGRRKVINFLEFLIKDREGRQNGAEIYANAISIWRSDISFLINMRL